jgi:catechol 2,3-dioxygenase-like lactoylglutathione lyase family enzyme
MELGNFSVSLSVADLDASIAFYQALGLELLVDNRADNWVVMRNETARIGLFQGMFEGNLLTFNPGWDGDGVPVDSFTDVRAIEATLHERGVATMGEIEPGSTGPAFFMVTDPDGNVILVDQHV